MATGLQITLSPEIAAIVTQEAARQGKPVDVIANDAIRQQYAVIPKTAERDVPNDGKTLADRFGMHIGAVDSRDFVPGGANLSTNTSQRYTEEVMAKHRKRQS